jgi:hypothetical protein
VAPRCRSLLSECHKYEIADMYREQQLWSSRESESDSDSESTVALGLPKFGSVRCSATFLRTPNRTSALQVRTEWNQSRSSPNGFGRFGSGSELGPVSSTATVGAYDSIKLSRGSLNPDRHVMASSVYVTVDR